MNTPENVRRDFIEAITKRADWVDTNAASEGDTSHEIYVAPLFGTYVALVEWHDSRWGDEAQFFVWTPTGIREASKQEEAALWTLHMEASLIETYPNEWELIATAEQQTAQEETPHCTICGNECGQDDLDEYGAHVKCAMDQ